jgi:integrase
VRTRLALRLAVLTFVRTTELRAVRWDEVDLHHRPHPQRRRRSHR